MTPQEETRIREWNENLSGNREIRFIRTEDDRTEHFSRFAEELVRVAPKIHIVREERETEEMPAFQIGGGVQYHGVPLDRELEPFLEALGGINESVGRIPDGLREKLSRLHIPATLTLFVAQHCQFCPVAVRQLIPFAAAGESIYLSIIDSQLFSEKAQRAKIQSVPTLLLDDDFRWTGSIPLEELTELMIGRDPSGLPVASLERMVVEGNAGKLAEMMLKEETVFPAFLDLLIQDTFSIRLGAMVAMEEIAARNPHLAAQTIVPLWERFPHVDDTVKGDILYLFGETGSTRAEPLLREILRGPYSEEVKEAATEALEKIDGAPP
jgi:hypothetical protein